MKDEKAELPAHRHSYVKIHQLADRVQELIENAKQLKGDEVEHGMEHRVKVWESDVPNRVETKLLFTKAPADDLGTIAYRLYGVARGTTDLWDVLCAFRKHLGDPMHFELVGREVMSSDHPFPYEDDWFSFQVWWPI